jgi:hypothetical protein
MRYQDEPRESRDDDGSMSPYFFIAALGLVILLLIFG